MEDASLAVRVTEIDARSKSNTHRIDKLESSQESLARIVTAVEVIAKEQQHQTDDIKEVKGGMKELGNKVDTLENKPAKRWDSIVDKVILLFVGGFVAYILTRLGL